MLDVERLKLTDEEASHEWRGNVNSRQAARDVADAATAKALWGLVEQLGHGMEDCPACVLKAVLEGRGIPNPEERVIASQD